MSGVGTSPPISSATAIAGMTSPISVLCICRGNQLSHMFSSTPVKRNIGSSAIIRGRNTSAKVDQTYTCVTD